MSFMKKNVNFGLLFIIIILATAVAALGIYYNQNYITLKRNYDTQVESFEKVKEDLFLQKSILNKTTTDLVTRSQDESEMNKRYTQLRDEKERLDQENAKLKADVAAKNSEILTLTNQVISTKAEITTQKKQIATLTSEVATLEQSVRSLRNKVKNICEANQACC